MAYLADAGYDVSVDHVSSPVEVREASLDSVYMLVGLCVDDHEVS